MEETEEQTMNIPISDRPLPLTVSIATAASLIGVSKWLIRDYIRAGQLEVVRLGAKGGRVVIPYESLARLVGRKVQT
jgi:predicted site-specific integrase-resolvase